MKNLFFIVVALLSFFLISCGEKEKKLELTHQEYYDLLKSSAMGEVLTEIRKRDSVQMENQQNLILKAGKADALELLIEKGWRPKDCFCCKETENHNHFYDYDYSYPKKRQLPENRCDVSPIRESGEKNVYFIPSDGNSQFPYITNAPVFNNYCCKGYEENKKPDEDLSSQVSGDSFVKKDTLIKKLLPWELELGAGVSSGPVGSLRFGNNRVEGGGIFLWNKENKTANSLVDFVLKPKNGLGLRYGIFYHNEVSPGKWDIPNQKTTTVQAGGVTTVLSSTSKVEVEQWNVSKQTIGPVFGLQGGDKFFLSMDVMPAFTISSKNPGGIEGDKFTVNGRVLGGYYINPNTLIGLNLGLINRELYPSLSVRFVPGIEKTTDNNN